MVCYLNANKASVLVPKCYPVSVKSDLKSCRKKMICVTFLKFGHFPQQVDIKSKDAVD